MEQAMVSAEKETVRPAVAADEQQAVVDRQGQADNGDDVEDEGVHVQDEGQAPQRTHAGEDGDDGARQRQAGGEQAAEDDDQQDEGHGEAHGLAPSEVLLDELADGVPDEVRGDGTHLRAWGVLAQGVAVGALGRGGHARVGGVGLLVGQSLVEGDDDGVAIAVRRQQRPGLLRGGAGQCEGVGRRGDAVEPGELLARGRSRGGGIRIVAGDVNAVDHDGDLLAGAVVGGGHGGHDVGLGARRGDLAARQPLEQAAPAPALEDQGGREDDQQRPADDEAHGVAGDGATYASEHVRPFVCSGVGRLVGMSGSRERARGPSITKRSFLYGCNSRPLMAASQQPGRRYRSGGDSCGSGPISTRKRTDLDEGASAGRDAP